MNAERSECPELVELEPFALSELSGPRRAEVESHVSSCTSCRERLADVRSNLALAALLSRTAASAPEVVAPDGYRLLGSIGRGGMGTVVEALRLSTGRRVALKVLHVAAPGSDRRERLFRREVRALARLRHPGIAAVLDAGRCPDGRPFLALELVSGPELLDSLARRGADRAERLLALEAICRAIVHAHQRGVIHRDLKPSNVRVDERGEPKVLDFGLARLLELEEEDVEDTLSLATRSLRIQGTLPYMSPEQVRGDPEAVDARSDVYALGVLGYEMLLGKLPYEASWRHLASAARAICDQPPGRPRSVDRRFPPELETILLKALEKDPSRRYATAAALADDLARLRTGEPIAARPPALAYQLQKLVARHKLPALLAGALVLAVLAGGAWLGVLYARAEDLRGSAETGRVRAEERGQDLAAALGWLDGMLSAADPLGAHGAEVRVVEVLEVSDAAVENGDLAARPGVEAAVRGSLGRSFLALGRYAEAERHLQRSAHLILELGGTPLDLAGLDQELGRLRYVQGRLEESAERYRSALDALLALLPAGDPRLFDAYLAFGSTLRELGRPDEAVTAFESAGAILDQAGGDGLQRAKLLTELARTEKHRGWGGDAEARFREALSLRESLLGEDHVLTATARENLAKLLHRKGGEWSEIEAQQRAAVSVFRKRLPPEHPTLPSGIYALATMHADRGDADEAERLFGEAIELERAARPGGHLNLALMLQGQGYLRLGRGELAGADEALSEALEIHDRYLAADHPDRLGTLYRVGVVRAEQGRLDEADAIVRAYEQGLGSPPQDLVGLGAAKNLASRIAVLQGQRDVAAELAEEAVAILREAAPNASLTSALKHLGDRLRDLGELDRARDAYLEAFELLRREYGLTGIKTLQTLSRLADVAARGGHGEIAVDSLREALVDPAVLPHIASLLRARLGACLFSSGDRAAAEEELLRAYQELVLLAGESAAETLRCARSLADLYGDLGDEESRAVYLALAAGPASAVAATDPEH